MTTIPDSISATLTTQWTAAGGVLPTIYVTEDHVYSNPPPGGLDYIWIPAKSLLYNPKRMNDKYKNRTYTLELVANSATTADRLKEISDEIERVLDLYPITGVTLQNITNRQIVTPERMNRPMEQITVTMVSLLTTSTSGYGANVSANYLNSLLMYGSANAAWVACPYAGGIGRADYEFAGSGQIYNVGAAALQMVFALSLPTTKGSLKLYVSGSEVGLFDADASNYVTSRYLLGITYNTSAVINNQPANLTTIAAHQDTFAAIDCSPYKTVRLNVVGINPNAGNLDIMYVLLRCYYA